jgi:hypothetical protein
VLPVLFALAETEQPREPAVRTAISVPIQILMKIVRFQTAAQEDLLLHAAVHPSVVIREVLPMPLIINVLPQTPVVILQMES